MLKAPFEPEVTVVCVVPSYFTVTVAEPSKPVPETVTVVPTGPLVGLRLMAEVTVNEAEPV